MIPRAAVLPRSPSAHRDGEMQNALQYGKNARREGGTASHDGVLEHALFRFSCVLEIAQLVQYAIVRVRDAGGG